MEVLDKVGDFFNAITGATERFLTRLFGASNERMLRRLGFVRKGMQTTIVPGSLLDRINQFEPELEKLSDDELRQTAPLMRARLLKGEALDSLMPEMFARVREAGKRYLKMRHYDVQMIGGYVLHTGKIAEMVTGEGKTLVATLPTALNALVGHVHVVTVNDYLARRDMEWMAPLYMGLGLTVNCIQAHQENEPKAQAYGCDITYGTNNEFGFDYLRDNMKPTRGQQVQGPLEFAVIDEIDNILIDEARTPLIISGKASDDTDKYREANRVAIQLKRDVHFEVKEKEHSCHLTEEGIRYAEQVAGVESFYTAGNTDWPHLIDNSLKAHHLYKRDVNYVVMDDEVLIVDEFTGRLMKGRQWSDGLHQAVEAKENVRIKEETQTYATITLQNFFKLYKKIGGMTGTAMTEANEFWKVYALDVVSIPSNRPLQRINFPDKVFCTEKEKFLAVVDEIKEVHETGRPVLVGTTSIANSEMVSERLKRMGVKHEVLNAKFHEREAEIIAQAGRKAAVTIATNMAGRGTDIILGGNPDQRAWEILKQKYESRIDVPKAEWDALASQISQQEGMAVEGRQVAELGGLHVIGTERHEARRIDLQLRGRAGRQGDPGSSRFYVSLEDELMRKFGGEWVKAILQRIGLAEGEAIESAMVTRRIEASQKKVEERNFDIRKNLLEYDEVMDIQRKRVYSFRQDILDRGNCRSVIAEMLTQRLNDAIDEMIDPSYNRHVCSKWAAQVAHVDVEERDFRGLEAEAAIEMLRDEAVRQSETVIRERVEEDLPAEVEDEREWNWMALAKFANARWQANTNDRELRKIGRDAVADHLTELATKYVTERFDYSPLQTFLAEDFGRRAFCQWVEQHFGLAVSADELGGKSIPEVKAFMQPKLLAHYDSKDIDFPVSMGLSRYMSRDRADREGLVAWANERFAAQLTLDDFRNRQRDEIREILVRCSRNFYEQRVRSEELDAVLVKIFGPAPVGPDAAEVARRPIELSESQMADLIAIGQRMGVDISAGESRRIDRVSARDLLYEIYTRRYRSELRNAECALVLEVLDTAWKDHLYFMDHLKSGIGLVGYAQKDPKVEFKREGMRAYDQMWSEVRDSVTRSILRLDYGDVDLDGLWQITAATHADAPSAMSQEPEPNSANDGAYNPSGPAPAVETIRNRGQRVGRNDPCPCKSGKKFKQCCGRK